VVEDGRGPLVYALIHGTPLVACAALALEGAGVTLIDHGVPWADVVEAGEPVVLHDPLCPMTPAWFIADCVRSAVADDCVVVAVRPVTDTVKVSAGAYVGATVDRATLLQVVSPVVLSASAAAALDSAPASDFAVLVPTLAARVRVETAEAPAEARRVGDEAEVRVLEALTRPG
jgi:2-C-methyl-D-erythritol 4-phosphate cytidylyltransferase